MVEWKKTKAAIAAALAVFALGFACAPRALPQSLKAQAPIHISNNYDPTQPLMSLEQSSISTAPDQAWFNPFGVMNTWIDYNGVLHCATGCGGLPNTWILGAGNFVTAAPSASTDTTTLSVIPSLTSGGTFNIFQVGNASLAAPQVGCPAGVYFAVEWSGSICFASNVISLGASAQTTASHLTMYGGSTANAGAYIQGFDSTGAFQTQLYFDPTVNGRACIVSAVTTGPCPQANTIATVNAYSAISWVASGTTAFSGSTTVNAIVTATHATSSTLAPTNLVNGQTYKLEVKQDGTGGGTSLLLGTSGSSCAAWKVANGGSGAIVLSTAANAIDVLVWTYDGTNCLATLQPNFN